MKERKREAIFSVKFFLKIFIRPVIKIGKIGLLHLPVLVHLLCWCPFDQERGTQFGAHFLAQFSISQDKWAPEDLSYYLRIYMQYFQNFPKSLETIMYSRMTSCKGLSRTLVQVASTSYNLIILFVTFFFVILFYDWYRNYTAQHCSYMPWFL